MATKNLIDIIKESEENGVKVKIAGFDDLDTFLSYFKIHYKPLLLKIGERETLNGKEEQLLRFLADDILSAFDDESESDETTK